jgi:ATP-binding protein involved in chromosome partitioning
MSTITEEGVLKALGHVIEPELHQDLVTLNMIRDITIDGNALTFTVMLTTPACPLKNRIELECRHALRKHLPEAESVKVNFDSEVRKDSRIAGKIDVPIKNIIAVSSGKGGVGKSTVSVNLAVALAAEGAKVGLLDADIYGPNIPIMMGVSELPETQGNKLPPAIAHNVAVMSMGFLVPPGQALVWRGPMLHSAIRQLFTEVEWPELDYLLVDLPPGTGDAQMSLAQTVPLTGGVIVTGPQKVSVADAERGVSAFQKLEVPILGVVENMAGDVFGSGGGEASAEALGLDFLGRVELDKRLREAGDSGQPLVVTAPEDTVTQSFRQIARVMAGRVSILQVTA